MCVLGALAASLAALAAVVAPVEIYLALAGLLLVAAIAVIAFSVQLDNAVGGFALLVGTGVARRWYCVRRSVAGGRYHPCA